MRSLVDLRIIAMDFNTVNPPQDVNDMAAHLCAHKIVEAMVRLARQFDLLPR